MAIINHFEYFHDFLEILGDPPLLFSPDEYPYVRIGYWSYISSTHRFAVYVPSVCDVWDPQPWCYPSVYTGSEYGYITSDLGTAPEHRIAALKDFLTHLANGKLFSTPDGLLTFSSSEGKEPKSPLVPCEHPPLYTHVFNPHGHLLYLPPYT